MEKKKGISMERLPREVMMDIISRLPLKDVLRCRCVSRSWDSTLSDPSFATTHFNRSSSLTPFTHYLFSSTSFSMDDNNVYFMEAEADQDKETFTMTTEDTYYARKYKEAFTLTKPKHLSYSFMATCAGKYRWPILLGSCNGYVCFSARDWTWGGCDCATNPSYLFNPITGHNILLPQFEENRLSSSVYGFGLDSSTQQCKVVLIYLSPETTLVQVHTVGSDYSWRRSIVPTVLKDMPVEELLTGRLQTSLPLGFNGSMHWVVLSSVDEKDRQGPKRACILSFQLDTEECGIITMPEPLQVMTPYFYDSMKYALQVCNGSLSIIHSPSRSVVDIWVMTNYNDKGSWVKQCSVQLNGMSRADLQPLGFRKNGELMLHVRTKGLVSYNTDNGGYKIHKMDGVFWKPVNTLAFPFVGSLISLKSAYGENVAEVIGTSAFGNPLEQQEKTIRFVELDGE